MKAVFLLLSALLAVAAGTGIYEQGPYFWGQMVGMQGGYGGRYMLMPGMYGMRGGYGGGYGGFGNRYAGGMLMPGMYGMRGGYGGGYGGWGNGYAGSRYMLMPGMYGMRGGYGGGRYMSMSRLYGLSPYLMRGRYGSMGYMNSGYMLGSGMMGAGLGNVMPYGGRIYGLYSDDDDLDGGYLAYMNSGLFNNIGVAYRGGFYGGGMSYPIYNSGRSLMRPVLKKRYY